LLVYLAVDTVLCAPDVGWRYHLKHVEQFPDKINCVTLHLVGYSVHGYTKMRSQHSFINTSIQLAIHALCKVLGNPKDDYGVNASVYVVQFNSFMSLIR
jgi:hypothetical protein